jgi:hypothetical protein
MACTHTCHYCDQQGHWNSQCSSPHLKCHKELVCVVPLEHLTFIRACSFGGRTAFNHPSHQVRRKWKRRNLQPIDFMPPTTPNNTSNNGMPPPNSLLFSVNSETHPLVPNDTLTRSFRVSPYQATPPVGTWDNAPWGTSYKDFLNQPPLSCIFDYGCAGFKPIYLPNPINNIGITDHHTLTLPPSRPIRNFGHEDLIQFLKEDLPGAVYPDNNPLHLFEPTI